MSSTEDLEKPPHETNGSILGDVERKDVYNAGDVRNLLNKLSLLAKKLANEKSKNAALTKDLQVASLLLQQETGEKISSLKELKCAYDKGTWKGRAQQMLTMQMKIMELEKCKIKKKKTENCMVEKESTKVDAARARIRGLECECTNLRQKITLLMEKSSRDDMEIKELNLKISTMDLDQRQRLKDAKTQIKKLQNKEESIKRDLENEALVKQCYKNLSEENAKKIEQLDTLINQYEKKTIQKLLYSPIKYTNEVNTQNLSELVHSLNARLEEERAKGRDAEMRLLKTKECAKHLRKKLSYSETENRELRLAIAPARLSLLMSKSTVNAAVTDLSKRSTLSLLSTKSEISDVREKELVKNKLEIAEERITILEDRIKILVKEKAEDFERVAKIVHFTKEQFTTTLQSLKDGVLNCEK